MTLIEFAEGARELWYRSTRENEMHKVKFELGDAPKPRKLENGLIALRAPLGLVLKKGTARINLGVKCDHALLLLPGRVKPIVACHTVMPNQPVTVDVTIDEDQLFETGETILYASPLGASDFEVA